MTAAWSATQYAAKITCQSRDANGAIAQLGERIVRNDEVVGSIPTSSTTFRSPGEGLIVVAVFRVLVVS